MSFAQKLIAWQGRHGRRDLPWQGTREPYRIWLAEVMLQQTQVSTVIPYYRRFLEAFPDVGSLAKAQEDDVLRLWSGLGYYARGRNLHAAARAVAAAGGFPRTAEGLSELPGVGRSTAAAIAVFAYGERAAILDGNVKRVLARCFAKHGELWPLAEKLLPKKGIETYTQALMDLGAMVCTRRPSCDACPVRSVCVARKRDRVARYPAPRPTKTIPQKSTTWLILRCQGQVALEKRPPRGVWGGLWCFPEVKGVDVRNARPLDVIEHAFTHFRLRIRPVLRDVAKQTPGPLWIDIGDAADAAVPAPVRKLLGRLATP